MQAVREHDRLWLERGPVELRGAVEWGRWRIESTLPGLKVRGWRPGDRLAGRTKKIQDVFVDAKIPRSDREGWPLVVRGDEVVAVPGIVEAEGVSGDPCRQTELERGVGEVLIDEERAAGAHPRARPRAVGRLRGPRAAARRRAQGRGVLHGRPDALADRPVRDRLHGDLELRRVDRLLGRRADPQGPRHQHRGPSRARRRGHHRLGPDPLVPAAEPRVAGAGEPRDLRPADEARRGARSTSPCGTSASRSRTSS